MCVPPIVFFYRNQLAPAEETDEPGRSGRWRRMGGRRVRGVWRPAAAYVGGVAGAGFASGQEVLHFFGSFGPYAFWAIGLAAFAFAGAGAGFFWICHRIESRSHMDLLRSAAPPPLASAFDWALSLSLLIGIAAMLAGSGALLEELFGWPPAAGRWILAAATFVAVRGSAHDMLRIQGWAASLLLAALLAALLPAIRHAPPVLEAAGGPPGLVPRAWWGSALLYVAYNLVLCSSLFAALGGDLRRPAEAVGAGAVGGLVLGALLASMACGLLSVAHPAQRREIPMVALVENTAPERMPLYALGLWLALWTTAVASTFGLGRRIAHGTGLPEAIAGIAVLAAALPVSTLGLTRMITGLYPLLGYAGAGWCAGLAALACIRICRGGRANERPL